MFCLFLSLFVCCGFYIFLGDKDMNTASMITFGDYLHKAVTSKVYTDICGNFISCFKQTKPEDYSNLQIRFFDRYARDDGKVTNYDCIAITYEDLHITSLDNNPLFIYAKNLKFKRYRHNKVIVQVVYKNVMKTYLLRADTDGGVLFCSKVKEEPTNLANCTKVIIRLDKSVYKGYEICYFCGVYAAALGIKLDMPEEDQKHAVENPFMYPSAYFIDSGPETIEELYCVRPSSSCMAMFKHYYASVFCTCITPSWETISNEYLIIVRYNNKLYPLNIKKYVEKGSHLDRLSTMEYITNSFKGTIARDLIKNQIVLLLSVPEGFIDVYEDTNLINETFKTVNYFKNVFKRKNQEIEDTIRDGLNFLETTKLVESNFCLSAVIDLNDRLIPIKNVGLLFYENLDEVISGQIRHKLQYKNPNYPEKASFLSICNEFGITNYKLGIGRKVIAFPQTYKEFSSPKHYRKTLNWEGHTRLLCTDIQYSYYIQLPADVDRDDLERAFRFIGWEIYYGDFYFY